MQGINVLRASQIETRQPAGAAHARDHTRDHVRCPACTQARQTLTETTRLHPSLSFTEAAREWLRIMTFSGNGRCQYVAPRTLRDYQDYVDTLATFYAEMPLRSIHIGNLRGYQELRSATAGPNKINQELGVLVRIMKNAGAWTRELQKHYLPLQHEESDVRRALTPEEQDIFIDVAARLHEVVHWYALLGLQITATSCEMRGLQLADVNVRSRVVQIRRRHAKNKFRIRTVPLVTDQALWAAESLIGRARSLGATSPEHFIFPFRNYGGAFDPARCMSDSGIKKPWDEVRKEAGVPWFRIHDVRHTAITRLAEAGTPVPTIMSMAGHISRKMWEHYTTISDQAKRTALQNALGVPIKRARRTASRMSQPAVAVMQHLAATDALAGLPEADVRELARIALAIAKKCT